MNGHSRCVYKCRCVSGCTLCVSVYVRVSECVRGENLRPRGFESVVVLGSVTGTSLPLFQSRRLPIRQGVGIGVFRV